MKLAVCHRSVAIFIAAFCLGACAGPSPYVGGPAPVVDRGAGVGGGAVRRDRPSGVEVTPLDRPAPLDGGESGIIDSPQPTPTGPVRRPSAPPKPVNAGGRSNQAVVALLDSAADHVGAGNLDKAAADLERALRIEPRNAAIWHDLGQIRLHQRNFSQAEAMATKSNSLAGGNRTLQGRNWKLIAVARRSQGDETGADAADAKAAQLQ